MPQRLITYAAWVGIFVLGLSLRLHDLEERPMHADEATGARILADQLEGKHYSFNPKHFHGPLLSLSSKPLARLHHQSDWSTLTKSTLRMAPALAGTLLILTPLLWLKKFGQITALASGAFLATSPLLIYYSRMYIHESLLALFAMLACASIYDFAHRPRVRAAILSGLLIGLMFATKETFVISILSWSAALGLYLFYRYRQGSIKHPTGIKSYLGPTLLLTSTAALTASYFYSDGFRTFQGIIDAVRTYAVYETTPGHEKSIGYYLHLVLWPKQSLGIIWTELAIAMFAALGIASIWTQKEKIHAVAFLAIATCAHLMIYSLISYKTPWLMLVPWAHACLLAGCAFGTIASAKPALRISMGLLFLASLGYQTHQSIQSSHRYANNARNPYAYVPTSKNIESMELWLRDLDLQHTHARSPIAVLGNGYWPLPWYLRDFETIGYWPEPTVEMQTYPIVFAMPDQATPTSELLSASHMKLPRSLRTNVSLTLYLRNDLWKQWLEQPTR